MPLPPSYNLCTVKGHFVDLEGRPVTGSITFTAPTALVAAGDATTVIPVPLTVTLVDGRFETQIPASDDPDITPHGWTYRVEERFGSGLTGRTYQIHAPAGGTVDLSLVAPTAPVQPVVQAVATVDGRPGPAVVLSDRYVARTELGAVRGVATLGEDGLLAADQRPPVIPGAHAASHASGGTDPITPAAIGAATDTHTHDYPVDSVQGKTGNG